MQWTKCITDPLWTAWAEGESLAMRNTLIATIVALSVACGSEHTTAPTGVSGSVAPPPVPSATLPVGNYEVVFTADAACGDLPSVVRTRTYSAWFDGGMLHLDGADFASWPPAYPKMNVLYVRLVQDFAYVYASDPPVWEHLTADTDLVIEGGAEGTVRSDTSGLSFHGSFTYCQTSKREEGSLRCEVARITCRSENHRLTLTRR